MNRLSSNQFEARDVHRLLGINRNRLFYWTHTHRLLVPEVAEADGTGKRAKFSVRNLVELAFIKALVESGTDLRSAKNIKEMLDEKRDEFDGGNAFDFALNTPFPDPYKMWLYRAGNKRFMAKVVCVMPNADVDFDKGGPRGIPGEVEFYMNRHVDERPDMGYVSIQIDIGDLAKEIVSKLQQV
jgi:hypothetical protein